MNCASSAALVDISDTAKLLEAVVDSSELLRHFALPASPAPGGATSSCGIRLSSPDVSRMKDFEQSIAAWSLRSISGSAGTGSSVKRTVGAWTAMVGSTRQRKLRLTAQPPATLSGK